MSDQTNSQGDFLKELLAKIEEIVVAAVPGLAAEGVNAISHALHSKKHVIAKAAVPVTDAGDPPTCPQGYIWSPSLNKCIVDIG